MRKNYVSIFLFLILSFTGFSSKRYIKPVLNEYEKELFFTGKKEFKEDNIRKEVFYNLGKVYKIINYEEKEKNIYENLGDINRETLLKDKIKVYYTYIKSENIGELKIEENGNTYVQTIFNQEPIVVAKAIYKDGSIKYSKGISDFIQDKDIKEKFKLYRYEKDSLVNKSFEDDYGYVKGEIKDGRLNGYLIIDNEMKIPYVDGEIKGKIIISNCTYDIDGLVLNGYKICKYYGKSAIKNNVFIGEKVEIDEDGSKELGKYIDGIYVRRVDSDDETTFLFDAHFPFDYIESINLIEIRKDGKIRKYENLKDSWDEKNYEILTDADINWENPVEEK